MREISRFRGGNKKNVRRGNKLKKNLSKIWKELVRDMGGEFIKDK